MPLQGMYMLSFVSQKGGVSKTTSAVNVAACLAMHWNKRVLLVDLDPQAGATVSFGFESDEYKNMFHVLVEDEQKETIPLKDILLPTKIPNVTLAPSDITLAIAEMRVPGQAGWDRFLTLELEPVAQDYDICIIDAPPSLGILSQMALITADTTIVPMQCQFLSLRALKQLMRIIKTTLRRVKPRIDLLIFRSMYQTGTRQAKAVSKKLEEIAGKRLLHTVTYDRVELQNAASEKQSIFEYANSGKSASEYRALTKEILDYVNRKEVVERA